MVLTGTVQKESPKQSLPKVTSEAASRMKMFFKIGALRNSAIFTGKNSVLKSFFNKVTSLMLGLPCQIYSTFSLTPILLTQKISM